MSTTAMAIFPQRGAERIAHMPSHADKIQGNDSATRDAPRATSAGQAFQLEDNRPEAAAHLALQAMADRSPRSRTLAAMGGIAQPKLAEPAPPNSAAVAQLARMRPPGGAEDETIEVKLVRSADGDEMFPICVEKLQETTGDWKYYMRNDGPASGWNDTDFFYTRGGNQLIQLTTAYVDGYWNGIYAGFAQIEGPDWSRNCEDYASNAGGNGQANAYETLHALTHYLHAAPVGVHVLNKGSHWMKVEKTAEGPFVIRQKDAESAVYQKSFDEAGAAAYIFAGGLKGKLFTPQALPPAPPPPPEPVAEAAPEVAADGAAAAEAPAQGT